MSNVEDKTQEWHVEVWVGYMDGHAWKLVRSIRPEKERSKALADCGKWMELIKQEIIKIQKPKRKNR